MPRVSMEKIVEAVLKGVEDAWKNYYKFSGGEWLWTAPEYYVTSYIFDSLGKQKLMVSLEEKMIDIIQCSNGICPGKPPKELSYSCRSDISVWWANGTLRGVIEVKILRSGDLTAISKDLRRICKLLKRKEKNEDFTIQFGLLVAYTDAYDDKNKSAKEKIKDRFDNVKTRIKTHISERCDDCQLIAKFKEKIKYVSDDDSAWGVIISLIKRK